MLGVGLKNAILFVLIILILHFLIRSILLERETKHEKQKTEKYIEHLKVEDNDDNEIDIPEKTIQDQKKELYDYVMNETYVDVPPPQPSDKFDPEMPVACDARAVLKPINTPDLVKKDGRKKDSRNNFLVIHEYEDESALNGGQVLDGLDGFDEYGLSYEEYKC